MTNFPTLILEEDSFGGSDQPGLDSEFSEKLLSLPGTKYCYFMYSDAVTETGGSCFTNLNTPNVNFNIPNCIQWIRERGAVFNEQYSDSTVWVLINVEDYLDYYIGYLGPTFQAIAISRFNAVISAIKEEFGHGVYISVWGHPIVRNYADEIDSVDWIHATESNRNARIADATARFTPLMQMYDFFVPSCYALCPNAAAMDPARRSWVTTTGGSSIPHPDTTDYDALCAQWNLLRLAGITVCENIKTANSTPNVPIFPSVSYWYTPWTPVFDVNETAWRAVPPEQFNDHLQLMRNGTQYGWNYWAANRWRFDIAFSADLDPMGYPSGHAYQVQFRNWISTVFFSGADPVVNGVFESWEVPNLRLQAAEAEAKPGLQTLRAGGQETIVVSTESVANSIRTRFKNLVATPNNLTVVYDNQRTRIINGTHLRVSIVWGSAGQVSFGSPTRHRTIGTMVVEIRTPVGNGEKESLQIVDMIKEKFTRVTLPDLTFRTPMITESGAAGKFWKVLLACPFYSDAFIS